jgi:hydroxysqualene synthase
MSVEHYENFPVASWLCPAALRPAVAALYWFARTADDLADEGTMPIAQRRADQQAYRADLEALLAGHPVSSRWAAVYGPLASTLARHDLPAGLLRDLLSAFEEDVRLDARGELIRYDTREDLMAYCRRSADPVGRLLLHLWGVREEQALRESDAICSALQLINFWQDLGIDLPRGRLYIPAADCAAAGIDPHELREGRDSAAVRRLIARQTDWAEALMRSGTPLVHRIPGRLGWELRLVVQGGLRIIDRIRADDHGTLLRRPKLGPLDIPVMLGRALWMP